MTIVRVFVPRCMYVISLGSIFAGCVVLNDMTLGNTIFAGMSANVARYGVLRHNLRLLVGC